MALEVHRWSKGLQKARAAMFCRWFAKAADLLAASVAFSIRVSTVSIEVPAETQASVIITYNKINCVIKMIKPNQKTHLKYVLAMPIISGEFLKALSVPRPAVLN